MSFAQLLRQCDDGLSVAAHVSKRDTRNDAAWADGDVVNIAACAIGPCGRGVHPRHQTRKFDQARGPAVTRPRLRTRKARDRHVVPIDAVRIGIGRHRVRDSLKPSQYRNNDVVGVDGDVEHALGEMIPLTSTACLSV